MQKSPIFLVTRWKGKSVYKTWFPKILGKGCDWPPHSGHCLNRSEIGKAWCKSFTRAKGASLNASLPSLALRFQPRSRPFV